MARLKDYYRKEVVPALVKQFGYASVMQVPRIEKIVLNMGVVSEFPFMGMAAAPFGGGKHKMSTELGEPYRLIRHHSYFL